jgi:hypothetical protein
MKAAIGIAVLGLGLLMIGCSGGDSSSGDPSVETAMQKAGVKAGPPGSGKRGGMPKAGDAAKPPAGG